LQVNLEVTGIGEWHKGGDFSSQDQEPHIHDQQPEDFMYKRK